LKYKFTHDKDNLYAYFRARGFIGPRRSGTDKPAGRLLRILAIDVDNDPKTAMLSRRRLYPTSGGYDVNAEIEFYNGRVNTGHYINHACLNQVEKIRRFSTNPRKIS